MWTGSEVKANVASCITLLNLLLNWNVTFVIGSHNDFIVYCFNCLLTKCVSLWDDGLSVIVVYQQGLSIIPVNLSGSKYSKRDLQILEELDHTLARKKRMVGLIIAGVTFITQIASATKFPLALTWEVQTSSFINHLAENVTNAWA